MSLQVYLDKYFPNGVNGTFEDKPVDLVSHFVEKFGVNVKVEGNLFQFKYDMLLARFCFPITHECRGHIWRYLDGKWIRVANPPNKFFNRSEGYCPIFNDVDFIQKLPSLSAYRKEDGTLGILWFDTTLNDWRMSTSGCITPFKVQDYEITFDQLFWEIMGTENSKEFKLHADQNNTYLFEICASQNRIVSKYKTNRLYLLAVRHNIYGTYEPIQIMAQHLMIDTPEHFLLQSEGIKNLEDLTKWVESNCPDTDEVAYREGFVIYDGLVPIAKLKTARYLTLHSVGGGNIGHTRNAVIDAFFNGALDDVYEALVPSMMEFADKLTEKVFTMSKTLQSAAESIDPSTIHTQKDYALWVQSLPVKQFSGFFFQHKDIILKKENVVEAFTWWIKNNYQKFDAIWKS